MAARLIGMMVSEGFEIYTRPYELNLVGLRADSNAAGRFDDHFFVFYRTQNGNWQSHLFPITTDPGTFWLTNPMLPSGTSILKEGQYKATYMIGLHKNKYRALVQRKPVTVIRDYNRNAVLDFNNGKEETGFFGINIHRAIENGVALITDRSSAGCQVFASATEFDQFMHLCEEHARLYGNQFSYTLIDRRAWNRKFKRQKTYFLTAAATLAITVTLMMYRYKKQL
ncbi:MAG TPA: hypothetical protein VJ552_05840 [Sediminibacterium sp.]|nr:hypothetical protein [Sediminibacterium sp.]